MRVPLLYLSVTITTINDKGIPMAPRIGPGGPDDHARASDELNNGTTGSAHSHRPDDAPRRVKIDGQLADLSRDGAANSPSRREAARWVAGKGWASAGRGFTKTRNGLSTAMNAVESFAHSFGIDRRTLMKGAGYAGGAFVLYEAATWLKHELAPMPLPVPDDVPASPERIAQQQKALFAAAGEEAKQVVARLSQPSALRSNADEAPKQQRAIQEAQSEGGQALIAALDRFWDSDIGKTIVYTDANRARTARLLAQIDFLELRPKDGEPKSQTVARREALEKTVKTLRQSDWTCMPGKDRAITCSP